MDELVSFLAESYFSLLKNTGSNYFKPKLSYSRNHDKFNKMSAAITPQGIVTEQAPYESIDDLDEKLSNVHPDYRDVIKERFQVGGDISSIYNNWINSYEGKEYIKFAKAKGKGNSRPGIVDHIRTISAGDGLVAATTPESSSKKIYINKDYIYEYASMVSDAVGLTIDQVIEIALIHELGHNDIQGPSDRKGTEKQVEYNNDSSLVEFYTGLAKKDMNNSDTYLKKAKAFTVRYDGKERKSMDDIISRTERDISKSYHASKENYRQAA